MINQSGTDEPKKVSYSITDIIEIPEVKSFKEKCKFSVESILKDDVHVNTAKLFKDSVNSALYKNDLSLGSATFINSNTARNSLTNHSFDLNDFSYPSFIPSLQSCCSFANSELSHFYNTSSSSFGRPFTLSSFEPLDNRLCYANEASALFSTANGLILQLPNGMSHYSELEKHSSGRVSAVCNQSDHNQQDNTNTAKRKRTWSRAVFSNLQRKGLERRFSIQKYITKPDRRVLASTLGLTDAQVKVWFQNRRMKDRQNKAFQEQIIKKAECQRESTEKLEEGANDKLNKK